MNEDVNEEWISDKTRFLFLFFFLLLKIVCPGLRVTD